MKPSRLARFLEAYGVTVIAVIVLAEIRNGSSAYRS